MRKSSLILFFAALLVVCVAGSAMAWNLTGKWKGNNDDIYYIHQNGNEVWWLGEAGDGTWVNVANGHVTKNRLNLSWGDVPKGHTRGHGRLGIRIKDANEMILMEQTGGFGDVHWWRVQ